MSHPTGRMNRTKQKPRDFRSAMRDIFKYCKPWYTPIMAALLFSVGSTVLSIIAPDKMADLTNSIGAGLAGSIDLDGVKSAIIGILIIYCSAGLCTCLSNYLMISVMQRISWSLRKDISEKINRIPLGYFDRVSVGDVLSRITNDVDTLSSTLNSSVTSLVQGLTQFIGVIAVMLITNWVLALTAIGSSLFGFAFMLIVIKRSQKYFRSQQKNLGAINGHIEETYSGHDTLRIYGAQEEAGREFDRINDDLYKTAWKSQFFSGLMSPFMGFIGNFGYVAVCVVGASLALDGSIDFGTIVAFVAYVRLFTSPLSQISSSATRLQSAAAAGERVFSFLSETEMRSDAELGDAPQRILGRVEFDHVSFGYIPDKPVIRDFSATVEPGQTVAIVGHTGAGKTTLVNLLMDFYELWSGEIRIDGVPISSMKRSEVHSLFGMVLQDAWLFEGSFRENITYGKKDLDDERMIEVCKAVGLHHYISTLPNGYDTMLSESGSLSEGQKQLLTIARAMVENAPMIILDEATSAVDTRTERLVQQAMQRLTSGRTSFVIAHRLSTIKDADLILVMDHGDVAESGTHSELLRKGGLYAELYNSQFDREDDAARAGGRA